MGHPRVVAIGEVLWDLFPDGERLGGAPSNFVVHAAAMGTESHLISAVGRDARGRAAIEALRERGVGTNGVAVVAAPTGTVPVHLTADGHSFEIVQDVAWDCIDCSEYAVEAVRSADVFCWGTLAQRGERSRAAHRQLLAEVPSDCLKVLDINFRQHFHSEDVVRESLERADVLKLNEDELTTVRDYVGAGEKPGAFCTYLRTAFGISVVVVTRGADGCVVSSTESEESFSGESANVVNTVGAGDAFAAGFALSVWSGASIEECARRANAVGAYVAEQDSGTPLLPDRFRLFDQGC